jgi:hypothetical protein
VQLLPYQKPAMQYARSRSRIALFLDMRLGKTILTIDWARRRKLRRVLLVAPQPTLVGRDMWEGELQRAGFPTVMLHTIPDKEDRLARAQWQWKKEPEIAIDVTPAGAQLLLFAEPKLVMRRQRAIGWFGINYEALRTQPELLDLPWDGIVLDESTRIRNPKAQTTKAIVRRTGHIEHRAILSGLPNPEDPLDFFEQFRFLLGDFCGFTNYWACRQTWFFQGAADWEWIPKTGVRDKIKRFVHEHGFFLSRKQAGVGSKKIYETRTVPLTPVQRRQVLQIGKEMAVGKVETKWTPVTHGWLQRIAGGFTPTGKPELMSDAKPKALRDLVTEECPDKSIVVWFHYNHEIDYCYQMLRKIKRVTVEKCYGATPVKERPKIQERFQKGKTRVLLIQIALGQFGWRLDRSSTVVYYSNSYEFEDRAQSEDRVIHVKKTEPVLYIDLVTLESTDEDVVDALRDKKSNAKSFSRGLVERLNARLKQVMPGDDV